LPTGCAYDLYLFLSEFGINWFQELIFTQGKLNLLANNDINNLNVLSHFSIHTKELSLFNIDGSILIEYCKKDYVTKPEYIFKLIYNAYANNYDHLCSNLLSIALDCKSFRIADYLLLYNAKVDVFFDNIKWSEIDNDEKFHDLKCILKYLIGRGIIRLFDFYKTIHSKRLISKYKYKLVNFIEGYLDVGFINFFNNY
jgi:hypothetical protein